MPLVTVTRRLRFNAAHRLHNPALSAEENRTLFGRDNNPHGHGHNYELEVSVNATSEDIVVACWHVLAPRLAPGQLTRLRLHETGNNYVEYDGQ